jgi:hypothetical protein
MSRRHEAFVVLLMVLLLAALGVALWRQLGLRDVDQSSDARTPGRGAGAHNPLQCGSTPHLATEFRVRVVVPREIHGRAGQERSMNQTERGAHHERTV